MGLLRRVAVGRPGERKEQATRLLNKLDEQKHDKFNQQLKKGSNKQ